MERFQLRGIDNPNPNVGNSFQMSQLLANLAYLPGDVKKDFEGKMFDAYEMRYFNVSSLAETVGDIFPSSRTVKANVCNMDNAKLGSGKYFLCQGIRVLYSAQVLSSDNDPVTTALNDPMPIDLGLSTLELKMGNRMAVPTLPLNVCQPPAPAIIEGRDIATPAAAKADTAGLLFGQLGYDGRAEFGVYHLRNPKWLLSGEQISAKLEKQRAAVTGTLYFEVIGMEIVAV